MTVSLLTKLWRLITLRCIVCGSEEHLWHRRAAIPRAWLVDGLAMAPGPDTLYRATQYQDPCSRCGKEGHCPHFCGLVYWCHDCDGPNCGGGCANDKDCPKRIRVLETGLHGRELYPDEWPKQGDE